MYSFVQNSLKALIYTISVAEISKKRNEKREESDGSSIMFLEKRAKCVLVFNQKKYENFTVKHF